MPLRTVTVPCNNCGQTAGQIVAQGPDFEYRTAAEEFTMVRCSGCGLVYLNPRPAPEELPTIYPERYIPYHFDDHLTPFMRRARTFLQREKAKAIQRLAPPAAVVWDVGCGGGFLLECLQKYGSPAWRLLGIDISESALEKVRARGIETRCGRFETLDLAPGSCDVIILNQVIEHLDDPARIVTKAHQTLKPGGVLFIETPSLDGWDAKLFFSRHWGGWHFPRHWTLYTRSSLCRFLESRGFLVERVQWLLSPNFWAQSVHHRWVDRGLPEKYARFMDCRNPLVMGLFSVVDLVQMLCGQTSNMRVIARKPSAGI